MFHVKHLINNIVINEDKNMVLLGTIVNVIAVIVGTAIGLMFTKINDSYKETIMHGIGLTVIIIGVQMALETESIIIVLLSLLFGAIIGEAIKLEEIVNNIAYKISAKFSNGSSTAKIAQGFITASLIFVVGAMAILGSLDSGIRGDHGILYTKSILDGFAAMVLTTTLGFGVVLSIIPLFLYQGTIALLASKIDEYVPDVILEGIITEITAIGGIMILAIGINILEIMKIRVTNLLPALAVAVGIIYFQHYFL